jgi:hypothetical protein
MTEIATTQSTNGTEPAAHIALPSTASMIQNAAQDLTAAHYLAKALCNTSFAPTHFRGKPEEGAAAIMYGDTIGLDPLAALQNIFMISGKPGLYARTMVAIVLSKGHEVWTEEDTPQKVTVCGRRKGTDKIERSEWTIERARVAGYTNNAKYKTDPQAMLYARAAGDVARKVAPDALLGMAYNVEELMLEPQEAGPTTVSRSGTDRLAAVVGTEQPAIEAAADMAGGPDETPSDDVAPAEEPQDGDWPPTAEPGVSA